MPSFNKPFRSDEEVGIYLQAQGFQIDRSTRAPSLKVHYEIRTPEGKLLRKYDDDGGRPYSLQGKDRLVVARKLPLLNLPPGEYKLRTPDPTREFRVDPD